MKQIAAALVTAQKNFAPALKTSSNPHFKSRYADLAACIEAVVDALNSAGIMLMQRTTDDATGVTVETVFIHESGEMLDAGRLHVPAAKQDPQGYGSALTYARRYSLMAACGIAPEDDDGNAAREAKERTASNAAREAEKRMADHLAAISGAATVDDLKTAFYEATHADGVTEGDKARFVKAKDTRKSILGQATGALQ